MTVAIALAASEGVVFGCDSTSTVSDPNAGVVQLFNCAQKLFEIGPSNDGFQPGESFSGMFMTYGDGSFGPISWRDLVNQFYIATIPILRWDQDVPSLFLEFAQKKWQILLDNGEVPIGSTMPQSGAMIAAVSPKSDSVHAGAIEFHVNTVQPIRRGHQGGFAFGGMTETICRLMNGYDPQLKNAIESAGMPTVVFDAAAESFSIWHSLEHMPLRDAIDFVHFLAYSTVKMHRYKGGPAMVGGAIEIATITADRGFRWILHKPLSDSIGVTTTHHFS